MKETLSQFLSLIKKSLKSLIGIELLCRVILSAAATPLLYGVFQLSLKARGLEFLSNQVLKEYLSSPFTAVFLILILCGMTLFSLFEMAAVIHALDAAHQGEKVSLALLLRRALRSSGLGLKQHAPLLILFVLIIIPLTRATVISGYCSTLKVPEFIESFIFENRWLTVLFVCFMALLYLIALRWTLSLHCMVLEKCSFPQACRRSERLLSRHYLFLIASVILCMALLGLALILLYVLTLSLLLLLCALLPASVKAAAAYQTALIFSGLFLAVSGACSVPASFTMLSTLYYRFREEQGETLLPCAVTASEKKISKKEWVFRWAVCLAVLLNLGYAAYSWLNQDEMDDLNQKVEVTAHRGGSKTTPENSMAAFQNAIAIGADWIELDVQQTKDGVIVVSHDENIRRISGKNIDLRKVSYDEVKDLDVGSWYSPEFSDLRLATLDEVMKECKGRIRLNIDVKPSGTETNLEQSIVDLIHENGFEKDCFVASQDAAVLRRIKQIDPAIQTAQSMVLAVGNIAGLSYADNFSLEESSVNEKLLTNVHKAGKRVYVWTVVSESNMEKMLDLGVDSIVADDPALAIQVVNAWYMDDTLADLMSRLFPAQ